MTMLCVYVPARTSAFWPGRSVLNAFWIVRQGLVIVPGFVSEPVVET
jgi:hypothetical protein